VIALALLLAVAPPPLAPATEAEGQDIVVLARKLRALHIDVALSKKQGTFVSGKCKVIKSADDPEIDAIGCAAPAHCSTLGYPTQALFVGCVKSWGHEQIVAIAERRNRARDTQ
jgi:hypothetical protein